LAVWLVRALFEFPSGSGMPRNITGGNGAAQFAASRHVARPAVLKAIVPSVDGAGHFLELLLTTVHTLVVQVGVVPKPHGRLEPHRGHAHTLGIVDQGGAEAEGAGRSTVVVLTCQLDGATAFEGRSLGGSVTHAVVVV